MDSNNVRQARHDVVIPKGLYVVADPRFLPPGMDIIATIEQLARAGAPTIQLRMKETPTDKVMEVARCVASIRAWHPFYFVVNDHPEVAREVGADAVHVGKTDANIRLAREIVGPDIAIGFSSHVLSEAVSAVEAGADYVAFGAIFPTAIKGPGHPVQGLQKLREVVQAVSKPVVAIGGINRGNVMDVWNCDVHAVAMITGISRAADIEVEVKWYRSLP